MAAYVHIPSGIAVTCDGTPNPALYRPVDVKPEAEGKPAAAKRKQEAKGA